MRKALDATVVVLSIVVIVALAGRGQWFAAGVVGAVAIAYSAAAS